MGGNPPWVQIPLSPLRAGAPGLLLDDPAPSRPGPLLDDPAPSRPGLLLDDPAPSRFGLLWQVH